MSVLVKHKNLILLVSQYQNSIADWQRQAPHATQLDVERRSRRTEIRQV